MLNKLSLSTAVAVATVSIGAMAQSAQAASFNFSYTLEGGSILSGMLEGEVQGDNDTVVVSAITMPLFNGSSGPALSYIDSYSNYLDSTGNLPVVSFSGNASSMDLAACDAFAVPCNEFIAFDGTGAFGGTPLYAGSESYGDIRLGEPYNSANWSLTPKETTPEPSSLIGLGVIGAGLMLRKRVKG